MGGGDNELLKALHGKLAGRKPREIAIAIYGARRVAAEWEPGGWMRSRVRRRIERSTALMKGGYRKLVSKP